MNNSYFNMSFLINLTYWLTKNNPKFKESHPIIKVTGKKNTIYHYLNNPNFLI